MENKHDFILPKIISFHYHNDIFILNTLNNNHYVCNKGMNDESNFNDESKINDENTKISKSEYKSGIIYNISNNKRKNDQLEFDNNNIKISKLEHNNNNEIINNKSKICDHDISIQIINENKIEVTNSDNITKIYYKRAYLCALNPSISNIIKSYRKNNEHVLRIKKMKNMECLCYNKLRDNNKYYKILKNKICFFISEEHIVKDFPETYDKMTKNYGKINKNKQK